MGRHDAGKRVLACTGEMTIAQKGLQDGLGLIGLPSNRNRLYTVDLSLKRQNSKPIVPF